MVPERTADGDALSYSLRLLQVRHEQPVRHTLLKVSDHCRLGFGDRDCQRLACGRPELDDADRLNEQTYPFEQIDLRFAYEDVLPPRIQCSFKRSRDVTLSSLLTFVAGV